MCYSVTHDVHSSHPSNDGPRADARDRSSDDAYLDAAREAILAVGWSRTTLTDIARRAGVSRMTLYRRWPDTETLLADLMTREWGRVVEAAAVAVGAPDDTRQRITRGVVATVRSLRANALLRRIVDVDPEVLLPYLLDRRGRSQEGLLDALERPLADGQRDGRRTPRRRPAMPARSCSPVTASPSRPTRWPTVPTRSRRPGPARRRARSPPRPLLEP